MYKKDLTQPRAAVRLSHPPAIGELSQIFTEGMRQPGVRLSLSWPDSEKSTEFVLFVYFPSPSAEAEWQFYQSKEGQPEPLWAYATSDILLVFNLLSSSMQSVEMRLAAIGDRVKQASEG